MGTGYKDRDAKAWRMSEIMTSLGQTPKIEAKQIIIVFSFPCGCFFTQCKAPHVEICHKHLHIIHEYVNDNKVISVKNLEGLPASKGYYLPEWKQEGQYRATAWAYLNREDGGLLVYSEGTAYKL